MKYASITEMGLRHVDDAIDTAGDKYDDIVNALVGSLLHVIVTANNCDMAASATDLRGLCEHYAKKMDEMAAADLSPERTLH